MWLLVKKFFGWLIGNPLVIVWGLLVASVFSLSLYIGHIQKENVTLNSKLTASAKTIKDLKSQHTFDTESNSITQKDVKNLDDLRTTKQVVIVKQKDIEKKTNEIPNTSINKPFTNPELHNATK